MTTLPEPDPVISVRVSATVTPRPLMNTRDCSMVVALPGIPPKVPLCAPF